MEDKKIDKEKLKELRGELMQKYGAMRRQNIKYTEDLSQNRSETKAETKEAIFENSDEQEIGM